MILYYVTSIVDKSKAEKLLELYKELSFPLILANVAKGTARSEHLILHDLQRTDKAIISTVASRDGLDRLLKDAQDKMYFDIPGNGLIMATPLKAVAGKDTLSKLTENQNPTGGKPNMKFTHELIISIINEGQSDTVMDFARKAGAGGGTVVHAKGTQAGMAKFMGLTLAEGKDMVYILASSDSKAAIMQAINDNCGKGTSAGAVVFSLPVSDVLGIRNGKE